MGMTTDRPAVQKGLDDVYVKESRICLVDGEKGRLLYVGYDIRDLAEHSSFEETSFLLWHLRLPKSEELEAIRRGIAEERKIPKEIYKYLKLLPRTTAPMDALRTAVSALAGFDPELTDSSRDSNFRKALRLTAKFATIVAAFHRIREGKRPVPPDPGLGHAEDFLRMLTGKASEPIETKIMDVSLILHADHSTNASTFASTVAASTLADLYAAIVAGIAALKGPLHGGANEEAMKMLEEVGSPEHAEAYIADRLERKQKIMGFGHAVYKTMDPRATVLKELSRAAGERHGDQRWFLISEAIERTVTEQKGLHANVDFYAASVYHVLDIPTDLMTPIFAIARMAGWTAHVREQYADNRVIRPDSEYVGPGHQRYVPITER